MNISSWLYVAARRAPSSPALFCGAREVGNYSDFATAAARIAAALSREFGLCPGDRVLLFAPNSVDYLQAMYGILWAGAVLVPVNPKLHEDEALWIAANVDAKLMLSSSGLLADNAAVPHDLAEAALEDFCQRAVKHAGEYPGVPVCRDHDDLAWIFYTSGTTGKPKGVQLTHGNLISMSTTYALDVDHPDRSTVSLYAGPLSHGAGLYSFVHARAGARHLVPTSASFSAPEILDLAERVGNLSFFAVPTMVRRLVEAAERKDRFTPDGIRTIVYGGGPMYVADIERALEVFGPKFVQIFGQGESPMTITVLPKDIIGDRTALNWRKRLASVGYAQACAQIAIVDNKGRRLPPGETGEVVVKGPMVLKGYWRNPEATNAALQEGWLHTGDLGFLDDDGFLTLTDRSKDVIISGGSNIYPREVEEVLLQHVDVSEVAVIGMPDPEWGEVVVAFIVSEERGFDAGSLDRWCRSRIAAFKRPRHYIEMKELPKSGVGKVLKSELRNRLNGKLGLQ